MIKALVVLMLLTGCSQTRVSLCLADCRLEADKPPEPQYLVLEPVTHKYVPAIRYYK